MNRFCATFSLILTLSNITAQQTLAILDFEGRGINSLEAATLTDRFTSEIGKTGAMRLVDRNMVEEILREQGFQQSGCTTDECVAELVDSNDEPIGINSLGQGVVNAQ